MAIKGMPLRRLPPWALRPHAQAASHRRVRAGAADPDPGLLRGSNPASSYSSFHSLPSPSSPSSSVVAAAPARQQSADDDPATGSDRRRGLNSLFVQAIAAAGGSLAAHLAATDDASDARMALWWDAIDASLFFLPPPALQQQLLIASVPPSQPSASPSSPQSSPPSAALYSSNVRPSHSHLQPISISASQNHLLNQSQPKQHPVHPPSPSLSISWPSDAHLRQATSNILPPTHLASTPSTSPLIETHLTDDTSSILSTTTTSRDSSSDTSSDASSSSDDSRTSSTPSRPPAFNPHSNFANFADGWATKSTDIEANDAYIRGIHILSNAAAKSSSHTSSPVSTIGTPSTRVRLDKVGRDARAAALEWFESAAELGHASASFNAALMIEHGMVNPPPPRRNSHSPASPYVIDTGDRCTPRQAARVITLYRTASHQGHNEATFRLALALLRKRARITLVEGTNSTTSQSLLCEALACLDTAAERGVEHASAIATIVRTIHDDVAVVPRGSEYQHRRHHPDTLACKSTDTDTPTLNQPPNKVTDLVQFCIAMKQHDTTKPTSRDNINKNDDVLLHVCEQAARAGSLVAAFNAGVLHARRGDRDTAIAWYKRAAQSPISRVRIDACYNLAVMHITDCGSDDGGCRNERVRMWLTEAARLGDVESSRLLGTFTNTA